MLREPDATSKLNRRPSLVHEMFYGEEQAAESLEGVSWVTAIQ
jgi:hypothetical protein